MSTSATPTGVTHEGGAGFGRSEKTELFLRATTMFAGEKNFYENAAAHDQRAIELARKLAVNDWAWMSDFLPWLRQKANIRTMSIMLAAQAVHARLKAGIFGSDITKFNGTGPGMHITDLPSSRKVISEVLQRADEPNEMLQYWVVTFGRNVPMPVKRGVADAITRMATQANMMRWDKPGRPMRAADTLELTHPKVRRVPLNGEDGCIRTLKDPAQGKLYEHLITARKNRPDLVVPPELQAIRNRRELSLMDPTDRHALAAKALNADVEATITIRSAAAGQWEWVMSWLGEGTPRNALSKREQWELVVQWMGYMAILRNLRNFDQAGLKDSLANKIAARIASPEQVAKSRQLPFRFLSAYKTAPSLRWGNALEKALQACIPNIPVLGGKTLVLIDTSGSMTASMSGGGPRQDTSQRPSRMEAGALFGVALALRNPDNTDVYGFATGNFRIDNIGHGGSVLKTVELITAQNGKVGHGTEIEAAVRNTYQGQDRVCIFTDMQTAMGENLRGRDITHSVPEDRHVYGFNLAGYSNSALATGSYRHEMGGLTDATFGLIPLLEAGVNGGWPWEMPDISALPVDDDE
jgi:hypothetical protein